MKVSQDLFFFALMSTECLLQGSVSHTQPAKRAPAALAALAAPAAPDMDEDSQLQLALSLSKEEHKQVGFITSRQSSHFTNL